MIKFLMNLLYLVPLKVKRLKRKNPDIEVFAAGAAKARKIKGDHKPRYEFGWAAARRSVLILASDGLHCGNWFVPLNTISEATLIKVAGGAVLKVSTTDEKYYQFGLQYDPAWEEQSVLPVKIERTELKYSVISLIVRLIAVGVLIWSVINDFVQQSFDIFTVIYLYFIILFSLPIIRNIKYK
jgi:hypothetical protein